MESGSAVVHDNFLKLYSESVDDATTAALEWLQSKLSMFRGVLQDDCASLSKIFCYSNRPVPTGWIPFCPPICQRWTAVTQRHMTTLFTKYPTLTGNWILMLGAALQPEGKVMNIFIEALLFPNIVVEMKPSTTSHTITLYAASDTPIAVIAPMLKVLELLMPSPAYTIIQQRFNTIGLPSTIQTPDDLKRCLALAVSGKIVEQATTYGDNRMQTNDVDGITTEGFTETQIEVTATKLKTRAEDVVFAVSTLPGVDRLVANPVIETVPQETVTAGATVADTATATVATTPIQAKMVCVRPRKRRQATDDRNGQYKSCKNGVGMDPKYYGVLTPVQRSTLHWLTNRLTCPRLTTDNTGTLGSLLIRYGDPRTPFLFCPELNCIPTQPLCAAWTVPVVFLADDRAGKDTAALYYCLQLQHRATVPCHILIVTAELSTRVWMQHVNLIFGSVLLSMRFVPLTSPVFEPSVTICTYADFIAHHAVSSRRFAVVLVDNSTCPAALSMVRQLTHVCFDRLIYLAPDIMDHLDDIPGMLALGNPAMETVLSTTLADPWTPAAVVVLQRVLLCHARPRRVQVINVTMASPAAYRHAQQYFRHCIEAAVLCQQQRPHPQFDLLTMVRRTAGALQQLLVHGVFPWHSGMIALTTTDACPVCLQPLFIATEIECHHLFCRLCIEEWFQSTKSVATANCPLCRTETRATQWRVATLTTAAQVGSDHASRDHLATPNAPNVEPIAKIVGKTIAVKMAVLQAVLERTAPGHVLLFTQYPALAEYLQLHFSHTRRVLLVADHMTSDCLATAVARLREDPTPWIVLLTPSVVGLTLNLPFFNTVVMLEPLRDCELRSIIIRQASSVTQTPQVYMLTATSTLDDIPNLWVSRASLSGLLQIFQMEDME